MTAPRLAALPLAAALACTFDSTGLLSGGPPDGASSSSSGPGSTGPDPTTDSPTTSTTVVPDTTTTSTTDPLTSTTDPLTSTTSPTDPSTGLTATTGAACGNGTREGDEACDGADLADQTCESLGLPGGTLACDPACAFDLTGCDPLPTCGNGQLDQGEECDAVPTTTCVDLGFLGGDLLCTNCAHDTAGCSAAPADWADPEYPRRRKLTITKDKLKGVLTDFPVVMALADGPVVSALAPASKLLFADPDKTPLAHELEIDAMTRLVVWVELDLDPAEDKIFYVYYGNPNAPDTEKPADTWSNGFLGVWHLDEDVPDEVEVGVHPDATTFGHDGVQHDNAGVGNDCRIGPCQLLGDDDWIGLAKADAFKLGNANATITLWFKEEDAFKTACSLFAKSNAAMSSDSHLILGALGNGHLSFEQIGGGKLDSNKDVSDGSWHFIAWTQQKDADASSERWNLYVDGIQVATELHTGKDAVDSHTARIGGPTTGSSFPSNCVGRYDEVQISLAARGGDWITTAHKNQSAPTTFVTVGPEENLP